MPYVEADPTDPTELVGVTMPAGPETLLDMAYAFAEEFARMGHDSDYILGLFRRPFYAGAYEAYRGLGPDSVEKIIEECVNAFGRVRFTVRDAPSPVPTHYIVDHETGEVVPRQEK